MPVVGMTYIIYMAGKDLFTPALSFLTGKGLNRLFSISQEMGLHV